MKINEARNILNSSTPQEIKKAYRQLALLHHPDKHSGKADQQHHARLFNEITELCRTLTKESEVNEDLTTESNENSSDDILIPPKDEYLQECTELLEEAGLDLNNLQVLNLMTQEEVEIVGYNLGELLENSCLNQESFDLACGHLSWPNKTVDDKENPYVSKFIFESLVAQENLNISSECDLSHYEKLIQAFKRLSGDENGGDLGWQPPYPNLVTQERLNYLIKHSSVSDDFAYTITRLAHVNLLTVENETFILTYLPKMADPKLFAYQLLGQDKAQTSEILQQARESSSCLGFFKEPRDRIKTDKATVEANEGLLR